MAGFVTGRARVQCKIKKTLLLYCTSAELCNIMNVFATFVKVGYDYESTV